MKYKKAKKIVIKDSQKNNIFIKFGWKFRWYPALNKLIKQWANEVKSYNEKK